jgi:uncharacterized membrane protein
MLPVPFIHLFARKVLVAGRNWPVVGNLFEWILDRGEKAGKKLMAKAGQGTFLALLLFVGIPLPGTGGWTGSLIAALLDIDVKKALVAEILGILIATVIMSIVSYGLLAQIL